jgi:hypothetical protein
MLEDIITDLFDIAVEVITRLLKPLDNKLTGFIGERFVARKLRGLSPLEYRVINNLMLPADGNTPTTQIDHVVVSTHGIFVIETKSHSGWIFGSPNNEHWTQVIYRKKFRLYNPLRQNYAHIKAIERVLGAQRLRSPIVSLVVFPAADKIKVEGVANVGRMKDVMNRIRSYTDSVYEIESRNEICDTLLNANITDAAMRRQHVRDVRAIPL